MFYVKMNKLSSAPKTCSARMGASGDCGWFTSIVMAALLALIAGCSSSSSSDGDSWVQTGQFIDSAVEGVSYSTATLSGVTDVDGNFAYLAGEVVSFYIGDILLGSAAGQDILTPLEFVPDAEDATHPEVTNILRFIQSLDEDGDPDNGITISELTITQAAGQELDFTLPTEDFESVANELLEVLTGGQVDELVDEVAAQLHFNTSIGLTPPIGSGEGGISPGGTAELTLSGADTALISAGFTADPALTTVASVAPGFESIAWQQVQPDTSLLEIAIVILNGDIGSIVLTWTNNSGSGPATATYAISCPSNPGPIYPVGDCSGMTLDTVAGEVGFNVSIGTYEFIPPNGATAAVGVQGLLQY